MKVVIVMTKVNSVKEIKKIIDKFIIPGYQYKTNFSSSLFLVDIESKLIIIAKPVCSDKDFHYEFVLDTQFLNEKEITYKELVMIKNIIEVLEENRNFVLKRLKKYTVDEYKEELRLREEQSKKVFDALQNFIFKAKETYK